MTLKTKLKVEGLRELDQALGQDLTASAGKGVLRRVGRMALAPFDAAWRPKVRVDTGALRDSGGVGSKLSRRQRGLHKRQSTVEVFAGPGPLTQAIQEEFGNEDQAPHPAVRTAWEQTKDQALDIVKGELRGEIDKARARAAKRTARLAMKAGKG